MKQIFFSFITALFAVVTFSGCAGIKELNSAMKEAARIDEISTFGLKIEPKKTTKTELFNAIGAPGLVFKNEQDGESWVYPRIAVRRTDLGFQTSGSFAALFPYSGWSQGGGSAGVSASTQLGDNKTSYKTAGLLVKFNADGFVAGYEFTATSF